MLEEKPREILAEFYWDGRTMELHSVTTAIRHEKGHWYGDTIDVDLSKSYGYVYHAGGSGAPPSDVSGIYWMSAGFPHVPEVACQWGERLLNRTRRRARLPREFRIRPGQDLVDWLEENAIEDEAVWCETCNDHLPSESLCGHCWYCDSIGDYVTPSEGSACFDPDCWDCRNKRRARHEKYRDDKRYQRFRASIDALMALPK